MTNTGAGWNDERWSGWKGVTKPTQAELDGAPGLAVKLGLQVGEEGELGDVVEDDHRREQQDADERDLVDALLDGHGQVALEEALDQQ